METGTIFLVAIPAIVGIIILFVIYSGRQHQKNVVETSIKSRRERASKKQAA